MDMKRVLIFPCGSEIGLELHRALWCAKEVELVGASSVDDHGKFVYENYVDGVPFVDAPGFLECINGVIVDNQIDYVIPSHDSVSLSLAHASEKGILACKVLTSRFSTCRTCRSKRLTYQALQDVVRVPRTYDSLVDVDVYPVFLKPDCGQGSKGTALVSTPDEATFFLSRDSSLVILENFPGEEFTVDCFTNRKGELLFVGPRQRVRISNGISVYTRPCKDPSFHDLAERINRCLDLRGMWFFQVKLTKRAELGLMEVAPRLAGTMGLYRNAGVNFPLLSLYDAEGYDVRVLVNDADIELDRALESRFRLQVQYGHVYVDLDDCIVLRGKVNTLVVRFLYQCVNRGIQLHLLSRHEGSIDRTLDQMRLGQLFDTIAHVHDGQPKSKYISHPDAIFIDDAFSERCEVADALGIPVFAPDAVECLLV